MTKPALPFLSPERPEQSCEVDALIAAAFGPGRYVKAAERLREGNAPLLALSPVALDAGAVVGCARIWPIRVGQTPALLLGPFAVSGDWQGRGLGAALIEDACRRAEAAGHEIMFLVGDAAYFDRLGFMPVSREVRLPGPVDHRRVLVRSLKDGAADALAGAVTAG